MAEAELYRLEAVLTLRQKAEDEAKEVLAQKLKALRVEEDALAARKEALAAHQRKRADWMQEQAALASKGQSALEIQRAGRYGERLREEEIDLRERIPPQEEKVQAAQLEVDQS